MSIPTPSQRKVIPFTERAAADESLAGGKGSSLAVLTQMALKNKHLVSERCVFVSLTMNQLVPVCGKLLARSVGTLVNVIDSGADVYDSQCRKWP